MHLVEAQALNSSAIYTYNSIEFRERKEVDIYREYINMQNMKMYMFALYIK